MSTHRMDDGTEPVAVPTVIEPPPEPRGRIGQTFVVVLSAIGSLMVVAVTMILKGAIDQAANLIEGAMVIGAGMAVGFRKRWGSGR